MRKTLLESVTQPPLTEPAPGPNDPELAALAAEIKSAADARLGRSLSIRHVDAGSCNGCELEIHALSNAFYDIERFGFRFVASPRHADVLLVTGPVTRNMQEALRRTYDATPAQYQGYFLSSSDSLNRMWFDGAYTVQLAMIAAGVSNNTRPVVVDGAKRDRAVWSGDLVPEGATIYDSLGSNGSNYVKQSFNLITAQPSINGGFATTGALNGAYVDSYSVPYEMDFLSAAVDYYRATADTA